MKRALTLLLAVTPATHAGVFGSDSFAECILDRMPGTANNIAAYQIRAACLRDFPAGLNEPKPRHWLHRYDSTAACAIAYGKDTPSYAAASNIYAACYWLYEPPNPFADPSFGQFIPDKPK